MHKLNTVYTDTGLWPRTGNNYDNHNVNNAVILNLIFHINFIILIFLNILIRGIVLPRFETHRGWCLGAETCRSFQNLRTVCNPMMCIYMVVNVINCKNNTRNE
jgi:hypothetical protein